MKGTIHRPKIFIGSSTEQKAIAESLKLLLASDADCSVWDKTFPLSEHFLDAIFKNLNDSDFGIFVLSDDDIINIREKNFTISRDNVIFEAGISIGVLAKKRTFLVIPANASNFHLPTDLSGFNVALYNKEKFERAKESALNEAVSQIKSAIEKSLWSSLNLSIETKILINENPKTTYKLKIFMTIVNNESFPITIESIDFHLKDFNFDTGVTNKKKFRPDFFKYHDAVKDKEMRSHIITLLPEMHTTCYVPIDSKPAFRLFEERFNENDCGDFNLRCIIHSDKYEIFNYKFQITSKCFENGTELNFVRQLLCGNWKNVYSTGVNSIDTEHAEIKSDLTYFRNTEKSPSFVVNDFNVQNDKINFKKTSLNGSISFENNLTIINNNILIGTENLIGTNKTHDIRYTRE